MESGTRKGRDSVVEPRQFHVRRCAHGGWKMKERLKVVRGKRGRNGGSHFRDFEDERKLTLKKKDFQGGKFMR